HEQTDFVPTVNRIPGNRRGGLDERHLATGSLDEAPQVGETVVEEFDAFLRGAIFALNYGEEPIPLQAVRIVRAALDRHAESLCDRPEPRVSARRHLIEKEDARAGPKVPQELH